jgi:hypothetical protein
VASVTALTTSASAPQLGLIKKLAKEKNVADIATYIRDVLDDNAKVLATLTKSEASKVITVLMSEKVEEQADEEPF